MQSLFDTSDRETLLHRIEILQPASERQWGKMNPAQALCHCATALEMATGDRPVKQKFIGKVLAPFVRSSVLGEKPFGKNGPTDPSLVIKDDRDFAAERTRLLTLIDRLVQRGTAAAGAQTHVFFGKLSGDEWGCLMYKHIDHHLRQFGV
jgi:hypothetical protein